MIAPLTWRALAEALRAPTEGWNAVLAGVSAPPPWYARLLSAVGTWFTALFLLGSAICAYFGVAEALGLDADKPLLLIPSGVLLLLAAAGMRRVRKAPLVVEPLAFAFGLIGSCFLTGYAIAELPSVAAPMVLAPCALLLAATLRDTFGRGVAVATTAVAVGWIAHQSFGEAAFAPVAALTAGGAILLGRAAIHRARFAEHESTLVAGGLAAVYGILALDLVKSTDGTPPLYTSLAAAAPIIAIGAPLARTRTLRGIAVAAPIVLAVLGAAGIAAGVLGVLLAIVRGSRPLLGFTLMFLVGFASWYYASLDLTLWAKAGTLAGSGIFLLALRALLLRAPQETV
jgi:hypothetical protein